MVIMVMFIIAMLAKGVMGVMGLLVINVHKARQVVIMVYVNHAQSNYMVYIIKVHKFMVVNHVLQGISVTINQR